MQITTLRAHPKRDRSEEGVESLCEHCWRYSGRSIAHSERPRETIFRRYFGNFAIIDPISSFREASGSILTICNSELQQDVLVIDWVGTN